MTLYFKKEKIEKNKKIKQLRAIKCISTMLKMIKLYNFLVLPRIKIISIILRNYLQMQKFQ